MYEDRPKEFPKSNKIYVSNLSASTTEDDLRQAFDKYGPVGQINIKRKDTVTFAFIDLPSPTEAEDALNPIQLLIPSPPQCSMNNQTIAGQEVRVQFARGERRNFGDRGGFPDRGGSYGGQGGYQSRPYDGDRPPRRDFGDRPRGCFNCGEEGHMIRDCTKPRKPREFNNNREGGYETKRYDNRDGERSYPSRSYGDRDRPRDDYRSDRNDRGDRDRNDRGDRGDRDRRGGYDRRDERRSRSRSNERNDRGGRRPRSPSSRSHSSR